MREHQVPETSMRDAPRQSGLAKKHRYPRWLAAGFVVSVIIALAAVVRRLVALFHPSSGGPAQMRALDAVFSSHALLTCLHIVPAAVFVGLSVLFYFRRERGESTARLLYPFGTITGVTAYFMSWYAIGGWVERSAVLVFNTWFLVSLGMSFKFHLQGRAAPMRRWLTRAIGVLLGIATTRPVIGLFFATSAHTHLAPQDFFGLAFWIGFSINTVTVEMLLHRRPASSSGEHTVGHRSMGTFGPMT